MRRRLRCRQERRSQRRDRRTPPPDQRLRLGDIRKTQRQTNQALNAILQAQLRTNELLEQLVAKSLTASNEEN